MAEIRIEKGIEVPEPSFGRSRRYPFNKMEVGDSFFVGCAKDDLKSTMTKILSSARGQKAIGKKFTTRVVDGGVRCWRIK
jgi:hypothetical protein